eukprot:8223726-Alexandrium_andersonii.AAC.1
MQEKRVLVTHWVGRAWERFCSGKYCHMRSRAFQVTGPWILSLQLAPSPSCVAPNLLASCPGQPRKRSPSGQ